MNLFLRKRKIPFSSYFVVSEVQQHVREGPKGPEVTLSNSMCQQLKSTEEKDGLRMPSPFYAIRKVMTMIFDVCKFECNTRSY